MVQEKHFFAAKKSEVLNNNVKSWDLENKIFAKKNKDKKKGNLMIKFKKYLISQNFKPISDAAKSNSMKF